MYGSREYDDKYLNDRLSRLEGAVGNSAGNPDSRTREQTENEQLRRENEILKQRLQMAADPIRVEFEQSPEFRDAWLTNIVSYLYEVNMAQWAQSPYAQKLEEWTLARIEEIRQARAPKVTPPPVGKIKSASQALPSPKEDE